MGEEDQSLPEGVERMIQEAITAMRQIMAGVADDEAVFWSKLKQMEVEFFKLKTVLADTSGELKAKISELFQTLNEVDLYKIGADDSSVEEEEMSEPRAAS